MMKKILIRKELNEENKLLPEYEELFGIDAKLEKNLHEYFKRKGITGASAQSCANVIAVLSVRLADAVDIGFKYIKFLSKILNKYFYSEIS